MAKTTIITGNQGTGKHLVANAMCQNKEYMVTHRFPKSLSELKGLKKMYDAIILEEVDYISAKRIAFLKKVIRSKNVPEIIICSQIISEYHFEDIIEIDYIKCNSLEGTFRMIRNTKK